jgi:hypothetical protein
MYIKIKNSFTSYTSFTTDMLVNLVYDVIKKTNFIYVQKTTLATL